MQDPAVFSASKCFGWKCDNIHGCGVFEAICSSKMLFSALAIIKILLSTILRSWWRKPQEVFYWMYFIQSGGETKRTIFLQNKCPLLWLDVALWRLDELPNHTHDDTQCTALEFPNDIHLWTMLILPHCHWGQYQVFQSTSFPVMLQLSFATCRG